LVDTFGAKGLKMKKKEIWKQIGIVIATLFVTAIPKIESYWSLFNLLFKDTTMITETISMWEIIKSLWYPIMFGILAWVSYRLWKKMKGNNLEEEHKRLEEEYKRQPPIAIPIPEAEMNLVLEELASIRERLSKLENKQANNS